MAGWIKLYRDITDHWIWQEKPFDKRSAWIDLILMANHKDNKFVFGNELTEVKRGSFITSVRKLCNKWGWSNTKVTSFLQILKNDNMIDFLSDTKKTVVTIVNYGLYQDINDTETTQKRHRNDTETTQKHTNKNDKNVKNVKKLKKSIEVSEIEIELALKAYTNNSELQAAIKSFIVHRRNIKKALTADQLNLTLKKLDKLSKCNDESKIEILNESVMNGWQGIFELKEKKEQPKKMDPKDYYQWG